MGMVFLSARLYETVGKNSRELNGGTGNIQGKRRGTVSAVRVCHGRLFREEADPHGHCFAAMIK
jgi:hypothetical protein